MHCSVFLRKTLYLLLYTDPNPGRQEKILTWALGLSLLFSLFCTIVATIISYWWLCRQFWPRSGLVWIETVLVFCLFSSTPLKIPTIFAWKSYLNKKISRKQKRTTKQKQKTGKELCSQICKFGLVIYSFSKCDFCIICLPFVIKGTWIWINIYKFAIISKT